jgi:tetraacyldisaccharide 4'-kinase
VGRSSSSSWRDDGGGELLPLGRLREPIAGLSRADAFVLSRSNETANADGVEAVLRRYNENAPVFRARVLPKMWIGADGQTREPNLLAGEECIAFCGLGNPCTFWRTIDQLGLRADHRFDYGDHHRYTPAEIRRLARFAIDNGIANLVTTAKDGVNLCPDYRDILGPIRLWVLEIGLEIDGRDKLIDLIRERIKAPRELLPRDLPV